MKIKPEKQIEIALLAGQIAKCALALQGLQDYDLLRLSSVELIRALENLEKVFPWKNKWI